MGRTLVLALVAASLLAACGTARPAMPALGRPPEPGPLRVHYAPELRGWTRTLAEEWERAGLTVALEEDPAGPLGARVPVPPGGAPAGQGATGAADPHLVLAAGPGPGTVVGWEYTLILHPMLDPDSPDRREVRRFDQVAPGWTPAPVSGAWPTPEAIRSGTYPLARPLTLRLAAPHSRAAAALALAGAGAEVRSGLAAPPGTPGPRRPVTLAVAGDFMLARGVGDRIARHGPGYPVEQVADRLRAADLTFANLESPIGVRGRPLPGKGIWFRARPDAVETLKLAGVDAVAVANNHILDYDTENFLETLDLLAASGIRAVGGGRNLAEARQPVVMEAAGLRVAFLAYSAFADLFWDHRYPRSFAATANQPGVAPIREEYLMEDIAAARGQADVVAVAFHWGEEYQNVPTREQVRLAHRAAEAGAQLVLGFHPHAIQGLEVYRGSLIAYSLGNFIMDDESLGPVTRESMLLEVTFYPGGGMGVRVTPAWITGFRPALLEGEAAARLLAKIRLISREIPAP